MTMSDVRAANDATNHATDHGTGRSGNDHAAAGADGDALPSSSLRREWHGG
jgi:hypothetical protein